MEHTFKNFIINKAGTYCIGHFQVLEGTRLLIGNPDTCGSIHLDDKQTIKLLNILGVDWEDGAYLQELLEGQIVSVGMDGLKFISIGDPFGNDIVLLEEGDS